MDLLALRNIVSLTLALACGLLCLQQSEAADRKATVRVTTGTVQINNWQTSLVRGNPNLGHWHWNPIYANIQGTQQVRAGDGPNRLIGKKGKPGPNPNITVHMNAPRPSVYVRPNHIPFNLTPKPKPPETNVAAVLRSPNVNGVLANKDVSANLRNKDVNGVLANKDVNAKLANKNVAGEILPAPPQAPQPPPPPKVATYGPSYGNGSSADDFNSLAAGSSNRYERSSVSARLATPKKTKSAKKKSSVRQINY